MHRGNQLFKRLFYEAPSGMVLMDSNAQILEGNNIFFAMSSHQEKDLRNTSFASLIYPEDIWKWEKTFSEILSPNAGIVSKEVRYLNPAGCLNWWRLDLERLVEHTNDYIFCHIEDVTNVKKSSEKLIAAKEIAEKATETKSNFLANMSHEIRTPIHTIIGMAELLNETLLDQEQEEYARQVRFSADVLLNLVNDILDFSKIEAGKMTLEETAFDLYQCLYDSADLLTLEAHRKGIEIAVFIEGKTARLVMGDPVRIRQIIINLMNNAVKFTSSGQVILLVRQIKETDSNVLIHFSVQDSGIGIPREKLDNLFNAFKQVDSSTTRKFGGTGLGLSISKNLVNLMGGEVSVKSRVNEGSEFSFSISFKKQDVAIVYPETEQIIEQSIRILLVDDNKVIRSQIRRMLDFWGCNVEEAGGGQEALEKIRQSAEEGRLYDLCICDHLMPGMDGWQMASELHAKSEFHPMKLALMIMTGKGTEESKMKLLGWVDWYLSKPIKRQDLLDTLYKIAGGEEEEETEISELEPLEEIPEELEIVSRTILIAEDHLVNQKLFQTILEKMGYDVLVADNGKQALPLADQADLIFMDVQMPEMNGYEASEIIRKTNTQVPIIAVTASAIKGERQKCLDAGMTDFLTKPFQKDDLVPVLEKWLKEPEQEEELIEEENVLPMNGLMKAAVKARQKLSFDFEGAVETFLGNRDIVISLLTPFIEKVEQQLEEMEQDISKENFQNIDETAHSIKGSSLNLRVNEMGEVAKTVEIAAKDRDMLIIKANFPALKESFARFKREAHKYQQ